MTLRYRQRNKHLAQIRIDFALKVRYDDYGIIRVARRFGRPEDTSRRLIKKEVELR